MKYIAYNTTLDVKTLIKEEQINKANTERQKRLEFENNKKRLLPYVLQYLHYLTELHNNVILKCVYAGRYLNNVRIIGQYQGILSIKYVIEKYTTDIWFADNGASYRCIAFEPIISNKAVKIWLNDAPGKYVHNKELEYSMTGHGS